MQEDDSAPTIARDVFFGVVNALTPEQPGGFGRPRPLGGEVWFNPQPDPPGVVMVHEPWRAAMLAKTIVSTASLAMSAGDDRDDANGRGRVALSAYVDELCGTGSGPRLVLPPPWPGVDARPKALDLVIVAAQFHGMAKALGDHPLRRDLEAHAGKLLEAALRRLPR